MKASCSKVNWARTEVGFQSSPEYFNVRWLLSPNLLQQSPWWKKSLKILITVESFNNITTQCVLVPRSPDTSWPRQQGQQARAWPPFQQPHRARNRSLTPLFPPLGDRDISWSSFVNFKRGEREPGKRELIQCFQSQPLVSVSYSRSPALPGGGISPMMEYFSSKSPYLVKEYSIF